MTTRRPVTSWFTLLLAGMSITALLSTAPQLSAGLRTSGAGWLITRVVDASGKPVNAIIVIQGPQSFTGRTDWQGVYKVALPAGEYYVSALYAASSTAPRRTVVTSGSSRTVTLKVRSFQTTTGVADGSGSKSQRPAKVKTVKANPNPTDPNSTSYVTATVDNPDSLALGYTWRTSGGSIKGTTSEAVWTAPQAEGQYTISVTISDSKGRTASASTSVTVQSSTADASPAPQPSSPTPTGTRDPFLWPFDTYDPWNMPIGSGAVYENVTGSEGDWTKSAHVYIDADQWNVAVWKATSSSPLRTVTMYPTNQPPMAFMNDDPDAANFCTQSGGSGTVYQIRIPDGATQSPPFTGYFDGHMVVADPDGSIFWEFYGAQKQSDGGFRASRFFKNRVKRDGWSGFRCYHAGRASGASALGGLPRAGELLGGIKHALNITLGASYLNRYGGNGAGFKWPATMTDANLSSWGTTGNVYYGVLLAIPASVNLDALSWNTVQGKNIAKALQLYGAYIVDGGNSGTFVIKGEYTARGEVPPQGTYTNPSPFALDLRQARSLLKVVRNNTPTTRGGGGAPLAPLAPQFP